MSTIIPVLPSSVLPSGLSFVRSPTTHGLSLPKASYVSLSFYFLNLFSDSPKKGGKYLQFKCLPDELFDETKDGRSDSLGVALNEIERPLVERVGPALAVIVRQAVDQTRR